MNKHGITISCEHCVYTGDDGKENFNVEVPVSDKESACSGVALLSCNVHEGEHEVEMIDWKGKLRSMENIPDDARLRMLKALEFIAQRRICGNRKICPQQVIDFVKVKSES